MPTLLHSYPPEESLWIAQHASLIGDARLGKEMPQRFLPTRFTPNGDALDSRGFPCADLACPNCHLEVPRAMLQTPAMFWSILGAPACGKSYFLGAMTWQLRQKLSHDFAISFGDVDPLFNSPVNAYEESIFLNPDPDRPTAIRKTELQGELYNTVLFGDQTVTYPRPFIFNVTPIKDHPHFAEARKVARLLCLYDNAGEHFLPGQDTTANPVTRHLARSRVLLFLFDPTQDPRFRQACLGHSKDPQLTERARTSRQETVIQEAAARIRKHVGLAYQQKHQRPLLVVVTKSDVWQHLLQTPLPRQPWNQLPQENRCVLRTDLIEEVSRELRSILWRYCPELVTAAESLAEEVVFVPVSATGISPEIDPQSGMMGMRPAFIDPRWVEVPHLYSLCRWSTKLIPFPRTGAEVPWL